MARAFEMICTTAALRSSSASWLAISTTRNGVARLPFGHVDAPCPDGAPDGATARPRLAYFHSAEWRAITATRARLGCWPKRLWRGPSLEPARRLIDDLKADDGASRGSSRSKV